MGGGAGSSGEFDPEAIEALLVRTVRRVGAGSCMLYLLLPEEQVLRLAVLSGITPEIVQSWKRVPLSWSLPITQAIQEHRPVWLTSQGDLSRDYPQLAFVLPYLFTMVALPITAEGTDLGVLVLQWPASHPPGPSPAEQERLDKTCHRLADLLQQAFASGWPEPSALEPRVVASHPSHLASPAEAAAAVELVERLPEGFCSLDLEGRLTFLNSTAANLLGKPRTQLLGRPPWEELPWLQDPVYEDRYQAALVSRQVTSFSARPPGGRWLSFELYPDSQGVSVRITPTTTPEGAEEPPRPAAAAPRRRLRPGALYQLVQLAAMFTEAVGVQDVVDLVADQIMPTFDAQGLVLFELENNRLRAIGFRGYSPEAVDQLNVISLKTPLTPVERMAARGSPVFIESPEEVEENYPGIPRLTGKAAWAVLPLVVSGRMTGCCLLSYDRPHEFSPEERTILTSLAGLIAQALARARLYDTKHDLAHSLQSTLLPTVLPTVPGLDVAARYLPATRGMDIGGDFYDLIHLDDETAAAVIGDVQGHNVTAAALMGQVRTAVHAHAAAGAGPGDVLSHTNRLLTDLSPGLFTSCLYAHIDLKNERMHLASAGHLPPLLRHPDGSTEVLWVDPGLLLGIEQDVEYPTTEVPLPARSVLVLYTDGLVESPDVDMDTAMEGLADVLSQAGQAPADYLATALVEYRRRLNALDDDIALLLLNAQP